MEVANAGDGSGRLFVVEQGGRIRIVRDGTLVDRPFLDIGGRITSGGERGLLGLAFHPDFPTDPRFFVDYTDRNGNTVVSSFRVSAGDPDVADADSESIILHVDQPFANHNGGGLGFGPDGDLYIALGDGGSGGDPQGNGQRLDTLLAKILRIDVDGGSASGAPYAIPADNPFATTAGARPEIWLYGLRNPWRFRFDRRTGDLWIGDVGQDAWEEIDVARRGVGGLDFGWNRMEGFHCYSPPTGCDETGLTPPVAEYGHDQGCAVIGGVVVRHPADGSLDGGYLFGDDCSDHLWVIDPAGDGRREPVLLTDMGTSVSSIGEAEDGSVYATSLGNGELLRIAGELTPAGTVAQTWMTTSIEPRRPSSSALVRPRQRWTSRSTESSPTGSPVIGQLAEPLRERRAEQLEPPGRCVGPQPQHRVEQVERCRGRPRLRRARDRVGDGRPDVLAGEAAEQLGQAQVREPLRRFDQPAGEQVRAVGRAARLQTGRDERVVVRPDRPGVVADRVVADLPRRERADPPAREHVRREQALGHDRGPLGGHDPGPQRLARVRGDARDRALLAVEGHRVETRLG